MPVEAGLSNVRVSKQFLLDALEKNLVSHRKAYDEAVIGYHETLTKKFKTRLKEIKNWTPAAEELVSPYVSLPTPKSYVSEYESAISLIKASLDEEFWLTVREFNSYVRDQWSWSTEFSNTSKLYSNKH